MEKVIVAITTYNLEEYIGEALDSILCQKTSFSYKIVIADDCSTDNTINILYEYQTKYPDVITILPSDKNLGSLKNSNRIFDHIKCEYFAFLDGDDYWIGEDRLQKQVDFLDSHPEYVMCGGNTQYLRNGRLSDYVVASSKTGKSYSFESLIKDEIPFIHTSSLLVRNVIFVNGLPQCYVEAENSFENCALRGEDFRRLLHLEKGPLYVMDDTLSVYRIHSKGLFQGSSTIKRSIEAAIATNFYKKYFGEKYGSYFANKAKASYQNMMLCLLIDHNLLRNYSLSNEETYLLTSLLQNLSYEDTKEQAPRSRFCSFVRKTICRLFL